MDTDGTSVSAAKATANYTTYGVLYNWTAALTACPTGWHLSTDAEWTTLENYLIASGYNYDGTTTGNKIAKAMATATGWASYTYSTGVIGKSDYPAKQNASGFSALPGGNRDSDGTFSDAGDYGGWWSSPENGSSGAYNRSLRFGSASVTRSFYLKSTGFSARCVRD